MIIQLKHNHKNTVEVFEALKEKKYTIKNVKTQLGQYLIAIDGEEIDIRTIGNMKAVQDIHRVSDDYKLVSKKWKESPTQIKLSEDIIIGGNELSIIAGPCAIESEEQITEVVDFLVGNNVKLMRGGVFKPRSSPYSFRGLGIEGLKIFYNICRANNIRIVTEVMEYEQINEMYDFVDVFQVGARNFQNFNLLDALGKIDKPILLKRGLSGTINELLYSAEYIFSGGNEKIILCERGIRTFEKAYRNTFDINAIPLLKEKTHLPVIADPSHGTGIRSLIEPVALASIMAGADGVTFEIHNKPEEAVSDGAQSLTYRMASKLIAKMLKVYKCKASL